MYCFEILSKERTIWKGHQSSFCEQSSGDLQGYIARLQSGVATAATRASGASKAAKFCAGSPAPMRALTWINKGNPRKLVLFNYSRQVFGFHIVGSLGGASKVQTTHGRLTQTSPMHLANQIMRNLFGGPSCRFRWV